MQAAWLEVDDGDDDYNDDMFIPYKLKYYVTAWRLSSCQGFKNVKLLTVFIIS